MELTDWPMDVELSQSSRFRGGPTFDQDALPPSRRATVENVTEENVAPRYAEVFPSELAAGATYGFAKTPFEIIRDDQVLRGAEVWGPFRNDEEWELAKWLIKNVGHNQAAEFLKLGLVSSYPSMIEVHLQISRYVVLKSPIVARRSSTRLWTNSQRVWSGTVKKSR